jgi:hypothetical protein
MNLGIWKRAIFVATLTAAVDLARPLNWKQLIPFIVIGALWNISWEIRHGKRERWNDAFAEHFNKLADVPKREALKIADSSDDSFVEGLTPKEAVEEELSVWGD